MSTVAATPSSSVPVAAAAKAPVVADDAASFRRGLCALVPELRGRALRLTGDPATADDVVQDTVERALRFASQYELGTNLRAWAFQILFSVFVTRYRRSRREKNALRSLGADPCAWTTPEGMGGPERRASLMTTTQRKLDSLPVGFRSVIVLVDLEERSYREAATALGLPVGTVMSRLHRGRKMLAEQLAA